MACSFRVDNVKAKAPKGITRREVEGEVHIMMDAFPSYRGLDIEFVSHSIADHDERYVRGIIHTSFAESYFSLLKCGIVGTFHYISHQLMYL